MNFFVQGAHKFLEDSFSKARNELRDSIASFELRAGAGSGKKKAKLRSLPRQILWNYVESRYSIGYLPSAAIGNAMYEVYPFRLHGIEGALITRESEQSSLQVLSSKRISVPKPLAKQWETSDITPLPDPSLAMQTETVACINQLKMDFGWSLVTALSSVLQKFSGHVQASKMLLKPSFSCQRKPSTVTACLESFSHINEDVARTWCLGYGVQSLQTQSVFVRFEALMSVALKIVTTKEFRCRPSIDSSLCELDDERGEGNQITEDTAFMGHPIKVQCFDHPLYENGFTRTKWKGVVLSASLQNLVYPEQVVQDEPERRPVIFANRRHRRVPSSTI